MRKDFFIINNSYKADGLQLFVLLHKVELIYCEIYIHKGYICIMKFICIFLSIVIMSLSAMPCCAEEDHCAEEVQLSGNDKHQSSERQDSEPLCSPFFSCGTCTGFSLTSIHFNKIFLLDPVSDQTHLRIATGMPQAFQISILKPPRLI